MLISGVEVNRDNVHDWSCKALRNMQKELAHNIDNRLGDVTEERLMMKLISIEVQRQIKISNINAAAEKKKEWTINNWKTIERRTEPLRFGDK